MHVPVFFEMPSHYPSLFLSAAETENAHSGKAEANDCRCARLRSYELMTVQIFHAATRLECKAGLWLRLWQEKKKLLNMYRSKIGHRINSVSLSSKL